MTCEKLTPAQQLANELAIIATEIVAIYPVEAVIYRYGITEDAYGGRTEAWAVNVDDPDPFMISIEETTPAEAVDLGSRLEDATFDGKITFPKGAATFALRDRLLVGDTMYEVQGVLDATTFVFFDTLYVDTVTPVPV